MRYFILLLIAVLPGYAFTQDPTDAFILKLIYGNVRNYGSQVTADHTVTADDYYSTCNLDKKLTFEITAKKSYSVNGAPVMLVFTSAPNIVDMNCPVPAGVAYLKKINGWWKVIDARKYMIEVGNVGQGGFYDFVKITDNDYAGLAYTDSQLSGVESTNMTIIGVLQDKIMNFTSAGPVTISQRNNVPGNTRPIWSSKCTFERGEDEVYVMLMEKSTAIGITGATKNETILYQFSEGTFRP